MVGGNLSTAALVVMATAFFSTGKTQQRACPRPASARVEQTQVRELQKKLAERDSELAAIKARLKSADEDARWYNEAKMIGVVDQVSRSSSLTPRQQRRLAIAIVREAHANDLDPLLVVAVIRSESSFDNFAVSGVGAMGLMQMMPDTGSWLAKRRGSTWRSKNYLFDSELNVELGCAYLASLIHQFGSVDKALVAYNAGPGMAKKILAKRAVRVKFMAGYPHKVIGEWKKLKARKDRMIEAMAEPVPMAVETALR
jgi:soluble lytic murein transglycosylase